MMIGPQPFDFKSDDGNCAADWQIWIRSFELFLKVNKIENKEIMRDWLLHYAGPKVQDIYFNLPQSGNAEPIKPGPWLAKYVAFDNDPYTEVVTKLQEYFAPKKNQSYERHVFRKLHQKTEERIDAFIMRLRIQANRCDFGEHLDENLKEQTTGGCKSSLLRRKILERDGVTFDELIKMARIIEDVAEQQKIFSNEQKEDISDNNPTTEVCKIEARGKFNQYRNPNFKFNSSIECSRCGLKGHKASFEKCPAKGKECKKCGKNDHFARKCFTREPMKRKQSNNNENNASKISKTERDPESVHMMEQYPKTQSFDDEDIFMLETPEKSNKIWCKIGGVEIPIIADTGSKNNIIDRETWLELKSKNIQTTMRQKSIDNTFRAYGGTQIKMLGMFEAIIQVGNSQVPAKFYVADVTGHSLLGLKTGMELGVVKISTNINNINHESDGPLSKIKNVLVEIPIKDNVKAVQQPYRRVPVPLEKAVNQKIDELLRKDIIEKVEFSNWISPLVVVPKSDDPEEIRLCVDMKRANEAVARENHPLPTIDDFLPELNSAAVFSKLDVCQAFHQVKPL